MLTQNDDWECTAGRSELFPWKDYSDKEPELGLIESPRARASRLFGGTAARLWRSAKGKRRVLRFDGSPVPSHQGMGGVPPACAITHLILL